MFDFPHVLRSHLQLGARLLGKCLGGLLVFEQALDFDRDFYALAARRARFHGTEPAREVGETLDGNTRPFVRADPGPVGHIGNRVILT